LFKIHCNKEVSYFGGRVSPARLRDCRITQQARGFGCIWRLSFEYR
jgi:hypothetical protein